MIRKHLLPNTIGVLILNAAVSAPGYIFMESTLSFLGIGLQAPYISLGTLIAAGQQTMDFHPYQLFFPALVLCLTVLAVNLFGDGLRDALDPRLRV
jgi:oligopeptide transport system permease protein